MARSKKLVKRQEEVFDYHYLTRYFEYSPEDGRIYHKEVEEEFLPKCSIGLQRWNKKAGDFADKSSYKMVNTRYRLVYHTSSLGKARFHSHRLAWLLFYKEWPQGDIDHIDGNGMNNKIGNLRDCKDTGANRRNIMINKERKFPRGVRFTLSGGAKTPTFKAWYRNDDGKDAQLYCGRDYFEACCARKSWENEMLKNPVNGYTRRHFGRE